MNNAAARVDLARRCLTFFATEWLEDVGPFDVALVLLGVNDAAKGLASEFKTHFSSIVSTLAGLSFKPALILGKPLPLLSREFVSSSQMISTFVEEVGRDQGTFFALMMAGLRSLTILRRLGRRSSRWKIFQQPGQHDRRRRRASQLGR